MRGQRHAPATLYPRERPGTHCTGGCVGPRAGLDRCGKSRAPTGIRSPDRPVRSQSLYPLRYPAHLFTLAKVNSQVHTLGFHAVIMICLETLRTAFICDMLNSYEKAGTNKETKTFIYFLQHQAYRLQQAFNCLDLSNVLRAHCVFSNTSRVVVHKE